MAGTDLAGVTALGGVSDFGFRRTALSNISPFSYREGATYLSILYELVEYINETQVKELREIIAQLETILGEYDGLIEGKLAEWQTKFDTFIAGIEPFLKAANDNVIGELLLDPASETGKALDIAVKRAAVGRNELMVDVKDHGAKGDGVTDDTTAFQVAANFAAELGAKLLVSAGTFKVNGQTTLKPGKGNTKRHVEIGGDIVQHAINTPVFFATGNLETSKALTADLGPRGRTIKVDNANWFVPGEPIIITSNDVVPNSPDNLGAMFRVIAVREDGVTVDLDVPYWRTMLVASSARAFKVSLHPGVVITGTGNLRSNDPLAPVPAGQQNRHMVEIRYANESRVEGLEIGPASQPAVLFAHCDGFYGHANIHDLKDSPTDGNFGYGWNIAGTSRNGYVGGRVYKARHGVTSNTAPLIRDEAGNPTLFGGESYNVLTDLTTSRCSGAANDTHRAGWDWTHIVNDFGSYGSLQIRADNVRASMKTAETYNYGLYVAPNVGVKPRVEMVDVSGSGGTSQLAVLLHSPAIIDSVVAKDVFNGIEIVCNDAVIRALNVKGRGVSTGSAITIEGNNNTIGDVFADTVGTVIVEKTGSTGNQLYGFHKFVNCGTSYQLQPYDHLMALRVGEYVAGTTVLGALKGRRKVIDPAGNSYGVIAVYAS